MAIEFNSQNWFQAIRQAADDLYERLDKSLVFYNEGMIEAIKLAYPTRLSALKGEIYEDGSIEKEIRSFHLYTKPQSNLYKDVGEDRDALVGDRMDHHKIIALYVQLLLEKPVFVVNEKKFEPFPSVQLMLVNEIFTLNIMCAILASWNGRKIDYGKFGPYANSFIKLLFYYKKHCELHRHFSFATHSMAHLIYFIERNFFVY